MSDTIVVLSVLTEEIARGTKRVRFCVIWADTQITAVGPFDLPGVSD